MVARQRLSLLLSTAGPHVPTKATAFRALANGLLSAAEITALFSNLKTITGTGTPETHAFDTRGTVEGSAIADAGTLAAVARSGSVAVSKGEVTLSTYARHHRLTG